VGLDVDELEHALVEPLRGLVSAARRSSWSTWLRAEHAARRAALAGANWSVAPSGDGWQSTEWTANLTDALLEAGAESDAVPAASNIRVEGQYPRSATAFSLTVERARRRGLRELRSDHQHGFRAVYENGDQRTGCSLHDVLA
jgi:hypothetical protein